MSRGYKQPTDWLIILCSFHWCLKFNSRNTYISNIDLIKKSKKNQILPNLLMKLQQTMIRKNSYCKPIIVQLFKYYVTYLILYSISLALSNTRYTYI